MGSFYGRTLAQLFGWSNNFALKVQIDPSTLYITPQQATDYVARNAMWAELYLQCLAKDTRTRVLLQERAAAQLAMLAMAKNLVANIGTNPLVTDAQRTDLGIPIRKRPTPHPAPMISPLIEVVSVVMRSVTVRLRAQGDQRGKPPLISGASFFSHMGETAPENIEGWKFEGSYTRTTFTIPFPPSTTAGTVWVTAFWFNSRATSGPAAQPVSINLPAASVVPVGAKVKLAA